MARPYQLLQLDRRGDVICVRLQQPQLEDQQMEDLGGEFARLIDEENCHKIVLHLGPEEPKCLFSLFLAKLFNLQRRLQDLGGALALCHATEHTREVFRTAGIDKFFRFCPDESSALQALNSPG